MNVAYIAAAVYDGSDGIRYVLYIIDPKNPANYVAPATGQTRSEVGCPVSCFAVPLDSGDGSPIGGYV